MKEQSTSLEDKLQESCTQISKYCVIATALIAFAQLLNLFFVIGLTEKTLCSSFTVDRLVHIIIVAICILIVSIPEGMPLAVSIAIAVST